MNRSIGGVSVRVRRYCASFVFTALVVYPVQLLAHGGLKSSHPARNEVVSGPLKEIRLDFSEPLELAMTSVRVTNNAGVAIGLSRPTLSGNSVVVPIVDVMAPGRYRVAWKTAGRDGHPVSGEFSFEVANQSAASPAAGVGPDASANVPATMAPMEMHHDSVSLPSSRSFNAESPAYVAIRFLQFTALIILLGGFAFWHVVLRLLQKKNPEPQLVTGVAVRHRQITTAAAGALLAIAVVRLIAQSYAMHDVDRSMFGQMVPMITGTRWGSGWLLQIAGSLLVLFGLSVTKRKKSSDWNLATPGALALAFSPALSGHAASSPHVAGLAVFSDGLHVMGAGGWLGSLLFVLVVGIPAALKLEEENRAGAIASLVNVFSPTALAFAGIAASTGVFAAWLHVGSIRGLFETSYGKTLVLKLGILSLVAATGAYNWLRVRPTLGKPKGSALLRRTVSAELAIAVLVLAVTAVLVATPTAIDEELMRPTPSAAESP